MKLLKTRPHIVAALAALVLISTTRPAWSQEPKYKANVPEAILTPDKAHTELLGDLAFFDAMPSKDTVKKVYDFLDLSRGAEAFLNGIPAASVFALLEGFKQAGLAPGDLGYMGDLMCWQAIPRAPN